MAQDDIDVATEKKRQASNGGRRKRGKLSIPAFSRVENTSDRMPIMANGLSRDHRNPRVEFLYLDLNSFLMRIQITSRYSNIYVPNLRRASHVFSGVFPTICVSMGSDGGSSSMLVFSTTIRFPDTI